MTEYTLLDRVFPRTADQLLDRLTQSKPRIERARIWLFEDLEQRQTLRTALRAQGIEAFVYSAYKPLVHFFLEEINFAGLTAVDIVYPVHPACHEARFRLEAYPLAAMLAGVTLHFEPAPLSSPEDGIHCWYRVRLHYGGKSRSHRVFAPNILRADFLGNPVCTPSAWLLTHAGGEVTHTPLQADSLQCYDAVMQTVMAHDWGRTEPYFDRLVIRVDLPGIERRLAVGHETISTTEALHEELYFSLLEFFQHHSGRAAGNRELQPGQIVPDIRLDNKGGAQVRVSYEPATLLQEQHALLPEPITSAGDALSCLAEACQPLSPARVQEALWQFEGEHFAFASRQQRLVRGVHIKGANPAVLVSGAQHANETTGVVGALRAIAELRHDPGAHLVLLPLENPDGYALHGALCEHNPAHMHHAARYSALGDDIEYRRHGPWLARRAREHAFAVSNAELHLNLHGYPAHEWTRPCTGYLPRGFESWNIPKGFFLILRHRPGSQNKAHALLTHIAQQLSANQALADYNARQLATYRQHANDLPFQVMNGIPYRATAVTDMSCEITLVTEFPDETIHGEGFIFGHSVQTATVLAATRWWWRHAARASDKPA